MTEQYRLQPYEAFIAALQDAAMTTPNSAPGTNALFDPTIFAIEVGDGQSINNSNGTFSLPLTKVYIFVQAITYGTAQAYTDDLTYTDTRVHIPFTVMSGTDGDQLETLKRLDFARSSRSAVFSAHGLLSCVEDVRNRRLAYSAPTGLLGTQYTWLFSYGASSTA